MFEPDRAWNEFYRELEPARRRAVLDRLLAEVPDDGANEIRRMLFEKRHTAPKGQSGEVDLFLFQCVNFQQIYKTSRLFRKSAARELASLIKGMGFAEAMAAGEAGEDALYREIRNTAKRYYKSCMDSSYRRVAFGILSTNEKDRKNQICKDTWEMTLGISRKFGAEESLSVWNRAVIDEHAALDYEAQGRFLAYCQANENKP